MKFRSSLLIVFASLLLTSCQTNESVDSVGRKYETTKVEQVTWDQTHTNLPIHFDSAAVKIYRTVRLSGSGEVTDTFRLNGKRFLETQFNPTDWFHPSIVEDFSRPTFLNDIASQIGAGGAKIHGAGEVLPGAVGHYTSNGNCWAVALAARLKQRTSFPNDEGTPDTVLLGGGCGLLTKPIGQVVKGFALAAPPQSSRTKSNNMSAEEKADAALRIMTSRNLCSMSLDAKTRTWETNKTYASFVAEAQRRGFTLNDCVKIAGNLPDM